MDTKTRVSVFQNPPRDARTVGNTEAQSPRRPQLGVYCRLSLCVSASLCFKIRPGMCGQLETRRHRVHGVGSLESIAASPSVSLRLCVSKSVQRCARTVGNTEAQSPRSRKPGVYCSLSLCVSASLCFKIRPEMRADSWKHGGTEFTESVRIGGVGKR